MFVGRSLFLLSLAACGHKKAVETPAPVPAAEEAPAAGKAPAAEEAHLRLKKHLRLKRHGKKAPAAEEATAAEEAPAAGKAAPSEEAASENKSQYSNFKVVPWSGFVHLENLSYHSSTNGLALQSTKSESSTSYKCTNSTV